MIPLIKLKEDLRFVGELQEMIEVMKGAASTQFRGLARRRQGFEDFKSRLNDFLSALDIAGVAHPFLTEQPALPKLVLMVTSDDGFLGSLNAMVVDAGLKHSAGQDELIVLGERGARYLSEIYNGAFVFLPGIGEDITYERAKSVRDLLTAKFLEKKAGEVLAVYPRFLSLTVQRVDAEKLLPAAAIFRNKTPAARHPLKTGDCLMEPDKPRVIDYLVQAAVLQKIYDIFWESKLSEYAARILHLESSHEEITSANKKLVYEYFKHLHQKSDKNIREIFASRLKWRRG